MGSKPSKAKHPASVNIERTTIPRIPQEIVERIAIPGIPQEILNEILDHLAIDPDSRSLQSSALVSRSWVSSCRRYLFHTVLFTPTNIAKWVETFPVPEKSPACLVRDLRFLIERRDDISDSRFSEHVLRFTNVEKMSLVGDGGHHRHPSWIPPYWRLPQSVTSLTIDADSFFLEDIRDIMVQLPNLNDLSLVGRVATKDKSTILGIGTAMRGRFGGKLRLHRGVSYWDTVKMLLEIPTGLHFTEMEICGRYECLFSMKLAKACSKTLVKLTYTADLHYGQEPYERPLNFSDLPNLQEVYLGVTWMSGGLLWIPTALSTIRLATSPRLSVIKLSFVRQPNTNRPVQVMTEDTGNDLWKVADEVARIEREFGGTLSLTVVRDPAFEVVSDTLNITWH